jgi:hypothetical protein
LVRLQPLSGVVVGTPKLKLEVSFGDEGDDGRIKGILWKTLNEHIE